MDPVLFVILFVGGLAMVFYGFHERLLVFTIFGSIFIMSSGFYYYSAATTSFGATLSAVITLFGGILLFYSALISRS